MNDRNHAYRLKILLACLLAGLLLLGGTFQALGVADINLGWYSVDGGGGGAGGGAYSLQGSVGQADAGMPAATSMMIQGGFWGGVAERYWILVPVIRK